MRFWSARSLAAAAFGVTFVVALSACGPQPTPDAVESPSPAPQALAPATPTAAVADAVPVGLAVEAPAPPSEPAPAEAQTVATTSPAPEPTSSVAEAPTMRVMQCESGTVAGTDGTETSSAVAQRVPADTPLGTGCHWID